MPSISLKAFAKSLGLTPHAVQQGIAAGRVPSAMQTLRGWTLPDADKARQEWLELTRPKSDGALAKMAQNGSERPLRSSMAAILRSEHRAKTRLLRLDYQRKKRDLIPRVEAEMVFSAQVVAARTRLLGVPSRYKQRCPDVTAGELGVLDELIREALEELAAGKTGEEAANG